MLLDCVGMSGAAWNIAFVSKHAQAEHQGVSISQRLMLCVDVAQVFVLAGPAGSGRSTLARQLLQDFRGKLAPAALLTNRFALRDLLFSAWNHSSHHM